MPINSFSVNALQGATPGLSRLAASLGGNRAYQGAYDQELQGQTKIAQTLAQIRAADAGARYHDAQTGEVQSKQRVLDSRPDLYEEQAALASGSDIPTVRALRETIRTGQAPQVPMGPPAEDGTMGVGSQQFQPEAKSKITAALTQLLPLLSNTGDLNPEQMAKARSVDRTSALSDAIMSRQLDRNLVGGAQAAAAGKDLYNRDSTGTVLDQFTGGLNESGGLAQSKIAENKATAADRYASAGAHNASAAKSRMDVEQGVKTGQIQVITDNDGNVTLLNKATGIARPATSADGVPLKGKTVADKGLNQEQANALTFASRMQAAQEILDNMSGKGVTNPGIIKRAAGSVPFVGDGLAAGVNALPGALGGPSSEQQQVEQARRDFINAVLRRESGAAISMGEFANADQQYFDQPGDSQAVKTQKRASRQRVIQGMLAAVPEKQRTLPAVPNAPRSVTVDY